MAIAYKLAKQKYGRDIVVIDQVVIFDPIDTYRRMKLIIFYIIVININNRSPIVIRVKLEEAQHGILLD